MCPRIACSTSTAPSTSTSSSRSRSTCRPTEVTADDLLLLIFTSGSTGMPKAVRCTQGRYARTGAHVATIAELTEADVIYTPLPFFHSSSLFTGWASAITAGIPVATRARFSASGTLVDIRRWGATMLTYTGKVLNYIVATPEQPDDADNPLRLAVGNEASDRDIREFARRFGCNVRDSYGSTEGIIIIRRDPSMPDGIARHGERVGQGDRSGDAARSVRRSSSALTVGRRTSRWRSGRSSRPSRRAGSRATTRTRKRRRPGSATAGTGRATSPIAMPTAGCTSPGGRTSGCASTVRTSPPRRSRRSWLASRTCAAWRCTPCRTIRWATA